MDRGRATRKSKTSSSCSETVTGRNDPTHIARSVEEGRVGGEDADGAGVTIPVQAGAKMRLMSCKDPDPNFNVQFEDLFQLQPQELQILQLFQADSWSKLYSKYSCCSSAKI